MSVLFDKQRKTYFIRIIRGKHRYSFYKNPRTGEHFKSKSDAKLCEPIALMTIDPRQQSNNVLCDDLFESFSVYLENHLKASTVYCRSFAFKNYIKPEFTGLVVSSITNDDLDLMNSRMNKVVAKGSAASWATCVHHWIRFLRKYNPALLPERFFIKKCSSEQIHTYHVWTREEEARFLSVITNPVHKLLFTLVIDYGFRITELNALKWEDINFERNTISVQRTCCIKTFARKQVFQSPKTKGSLRTLSLLKEVKNLLPKGKRTGFLFPGVESTVIGENTIRKLNRVYAKKAGLVPLKMHEFRHSCASNLLKEGLPVRLVARWLGDTESTVMEYYSHLFGDEENNVATWMEQHPVSETSSNH